MSRGLNDDRTTASVLREQNATIKRIAWAFGCAKKDSEVESELYNLLLDRVLDRLKARGRLA